MGDGAISEPIDLKTAPAGRRRGRKPGDGRQVLPLYHRIFMALAEQLREGRFPLGQALPSELQLAERYGVSRVTIRRSFTGVYWLKVDGLNQQAKVHRIR